MAPRKRRGGPGGEGKSAAGAAAAAVDDTKPVLVPLNSNLVWQLRVRLIPLSWNSSVSEPGSVGWNH